MDKLSQSFRIKRRGASAVEFAMVAPVFFLLVFGMIEYGRMVMVQQLITNATREGARRAVLDGATASDVRSVVREYLTSASITVSDDDITIDPPDPNSAPFGDPISVALQVPFSEVSWLPTPIYLGEAQLTASSVMRRESVE